MMVFPFSPDALPDSSSGYSSTQKQYQLSEVWHHGSAHLLSHDYAGPLEPSYDQQKINDLLKAEEDHYDHDQNKYVCPICQKTYVAKSGLRVHVKVKHQHQYFAYCPICNKGFRSSIHLRGHMATHGQASHFQCSVCGQHYAHKTSLRAHEKIAHGMI